MRLSVTEINNATKPSLPDYHHQQLEATLKQLHLPLLLETHLWTWPCHTSLVSEVHDQAWTSTHCKHTDTHRHTHRHTHSLHLPRSTWQLRQQATLLSQSQAMRWQACWISFAGNSTSGFSHCNTCPVMHSHHSEFHISHWNINRIVSSSRADDFQKSHKFIYNVLRDSADTKYKHAKVNTANQQTPTQ